MSIKGRREFWEGPSWAAIPCWEQSMYKISITQTVCAGMQLEEALNNRPGHQD